MKLAEIQLKQIIKEEIEKHYLFNEAHGSEPWEDIYGVLIGALEAHGVDLSGAVIRIVEEASKNISEVPEDARTQQARDLSRLHGWGADK